MEEGGRAPWRCKVSGGRAVSNVSSESITIFFNDPRFEYEKLSTLDL